jgi:hypothetical protein
MVIKPYQWTLMEALKLRLQQDTAFTLCITTTYGWSCGYALVSLGADCMEVRQLSAGHSGLIQSPDVIFIQYSAIAMVRIEEG